jgi:hypothetical protein
MECLQVIANLKFERLSPLIRHASITRLYKKRSKPVCTGSHFAGSYTVLFYSTVPFLPFPTGILATHREIRRLSVFGADEVGHGLGLGLVVVRAIGALMNIVLAVAVAVAVVALRRANVVHLVDGAALRAALDGAVAGGSEPDDNVGIGGVTGAAKVLLVTERLDGDGVVKRS